MNFFGSTVTVIKGKRGTVTVILREARENFEHFWHIFKGISLFGREAPENFGCF